jgi:acyl-CoA synthetase (AMP-forming)/AMP-acid ligase II
MEWSLVGVHDAVAAAAPDRDALVWGTTRRTNRELQTRSSGLAAFLQTRGVGLRRERDELERWECGQDRVALLLHNCPEYVETMLGCYRARAVPFNVNQHYRPAEIRTLFEVVDPRAVVYHRALGPLLRVAWDLDGLVLIHVDDGSSEAALPGSRPYDEAVAWSGDDVAVPVPAPDDVYLVCTGGTTGAPKAVIWRQGDIYISALGGDPEATADTIAQRTAPGAGSWFAVPPLMHAAAQWTAFGGLLNGATIVLHDDSKPFDARAILETAERERVNLLTIVADAYARPLIEELRRRPYDLSGLGRIATGGAVTSATAKRELLELIPGVHIVDGYGASETGGMAHGQSSRDGQATGFAPAVGAAVLSDDRTRFLEPGDDEIGWTSRRGRVPLGYLGDPGRTAATFPVIGGERVSVPGDRAQYRPDGTIVILGRDANVINTGGEKVFVEEVEQVLLQHPAILDALAVGSPDERYGECVVAIVELADGQAIDAGEVREHVAASLARFKAPRRVAFCERIARHASGKPDYQWARATALEAVDATVPVP